MTSLIMPLSTRTKFFVLCFFISTAFSVLLLANWNNLNSISVAFSLSVVILSISFAHVAFVAPAGKLDDLAGHLKEWDFPLKADVKDMGEIGKLAGHLNEAFPCINHLKTTGQYIDLMKNRDLTQVDRIRLTQGTAKDVPVVCRLIADYREVVLLMQNDLKTIQNSLIETSNVLGSVLGLTGDLGSATQGQSAELSQTTRSLEENVNTINFIAEIGAKSKDSVDNIVGSISNNVSQMATLSESIQKIQDSTRQITNIITVIKDIADQTNLLALNAAIEAARAGEQGRGFAVVADEVRKLAEKVAKATQDVVGLINETEDRVGIGVNIVSSLVIDNRQIETQAVQIKEGIDNLASAVEEQSASMVELKNSAEKIAAESESVNASTSELTDTILKMVDSMDGASTIVNSYKT